jgi:hypothetical protein
MGRLGSAVRSTRRAWHSGKIHARATRASHTPIFSLGQLRRVGHGALEGLGRGHPEVRGHLHLTGAGWIREPQCWSGLDHVPLRSAADSDSLVDGSAGEACPSRPADVAAAPDLVQRAAVRGDLRAPPPSAPGTPPQPPTLPPNAGLAGRLRSEMPRRGRW